MFNIFFRVENWIIERTYPLPIERIPTQFAKRTYSPEEDDKRTRLINSDVNIWEWEDIRLVRGFFLSLKHNIISDEKSNIQQQQDIRFGDGNYSDFVPIVGFRIQSLHYV